MYKLLLVDDEAKLLSGLCDYYPWNELGFEIAGKMSNGKQAYDYILNNEVDVVLTDILMPVMNGIELAEILHREKFELKVVFLSGYADFKYAQRALKYGVKDYILKPVKTDDIKNVFTQLKNNLDQKKAASKENDENYYQRLIHKIEQYVKNNLADANLEDAGKRVNLSSGYISTLFRQETGMNFSEYVLKEKMCYAKELLMEPNYKTYDVADLLGYKSAKNFSRTFRTFYGMSPREYRRLEYEEKE
ncbi:MAG: response regulator [Anaerocolumna sp.]